MHAFPAFFPLAGKTVVIVGVGAAAEAKVRLFAALFASLQDEVRHALPEPHRRRAFLRAALTGPAAEAAMRGDQAGAVRLLRQALEQDAPGVGAVIYIDARGPADALTLRAAR